MRKLMIVAALVASFALVGCDDEKTNKDQQADKAAVAAAKIDFTENSEIDNIQRRLELTSKPSAIGYVVLLNQAGQPILYTSVKGKITSSGKRLTKPYKIAYQSFEVPSPSDEGTWGSSDPYIYFWDTNGVYHQWSGSYLYSDKPIRLRVEPLVVSTAE